MLASTLDAVAGTLSVPVQLRRDSRGRSCAASWPLRAADRLGRVGGENVAHRAQARHRRPSRIICSTELRPEQADAVQRLIEEDTSVLIAPPGLGKTEIACAAIASRAPSALILVD